MKVEKKEKFKVLTPEEDMWLFNEGVGVFSEEVTMPLNCDETSWQDVTEEFKGNYEEEHKPQ